jgi:hypothetical protein
VRDTSNLELEVIEVRGYKRGRQQSHYDLSEHDQLFTHPKLL